MWDVHKGGPWQTENLQLQWHSLAAQVIADISNAWSAKHTCQQTCKRTWVFTRGTKVYVKCRLPSTPPQQSKYINSTAQRACWCSFTFFNKIKSWNNYNNAILLQLYITVWYKSTEIYQNLTCKMPQNKTCTMWTNTEILFQFIYVSFSIFLTLFFIYYTTI